MLFKSFLCVFDNTKNSNESSLSFAIDILDKNPLYSANIVKIILVPLVYPKSQRKIEVFDSILIQYRYKTSYESLAKAKVLGHS